jgi:uncharacterized membrane protein YsdA (DUF1294 family)
LTINFTLMTVLLYCFLILNFLAFVVTGYDKRLAVINKRRISEKTLLTFVAIGSSVAMLLFRHKTSKMAYLWKFYGIVLVQILLISGLMYFGKLHYKV